MVCLLKANPCTAHARVHNPPCYLKESKYLHYFESLSLDTTESLSLDTTESLSHCLTLPTEVTIFFFLSHTVLAYLHKREAHFDGSNARA